MLFLLRHWNYNATTTTPTFSFVTEEDIDNAPTVDVLDKIRDEIERLHYHPKLDFIKNDEVVDMALDIIDKIQGIKEI